MKIDFSKNKNELCVSLDGRLDTVSAPELDKLLETKLSGISSLTIDCKELSYVSSAGLRVLLSAHKKLSGAMKLTGVCELVMEVFEMTGFADILVIE